MCAADAHVETISERSPGQRDLGMFGLGGRRTRERIEPRLDAPWRRRDDLHADPEDRPGYRAKRSGGRNEARRGGRRASGGRRSTFGRLVYWSIVLAVW